MKNPEAYGLIPLNEDSQTPVYQHKLKRIVSARDLYERLQIKKDFSDWVKGKIGVHRFASGLDYVRLEPETLLPQKGEQKNGKRGGHNRTEYAFSLEAAKIIAMGTNNAVGDKVKRYFLECEKIALLPRPEPVPRQKVIEHTFPTRQVANSQAAQRFLAKHGANAAITYHRDSYAQHLGLTGRQIKEAGRAAGLKGADLANGRAVLRKLEPSLACALSLQDHLTVFDVPRAEAIRIAATSHELFDAIIATGKFLPVEATRRQ